MKKLMQGGTIAVAVIMCASFAFAGSQQSVSDNTLVKSLISGKMTQAQTQLVAQTAIPRAQTTADTANQQQATKQQQAAAAKAKQAQQQAARQQQTVRQQQLMRQQQMIRQQRAQAARQQQAQAATAAATAEAQQNFAAAQENPLAAFESFESTFVAPEAVSDISAATEQAVQNVEETLSPSAPTSSN